jgi:hypothetical protein
VCCRRYGPYVSWEDELERVEEAKDTPWGEWVRLVGRKKAVGKGDWIAALSDAAVS